MREHLLHLTKNFLSSELALKYHIKVRTQALFKISGAQKIIKKHSIKKIYAICNYYARREMRDACEGSIATKRGHTCSELETAFQHKGTSKYSAYSERLKDFSSV